MATDEHQPQQVIFDLIRCDAVEVRHHRLLVEFEVMTELGGLAFEPFGSSEVVDRPALRDSHEPGARVVRDA